MDLICRVVSIGAAHEGFIGLSIKQRRFTEVPIEGQERSGKADTIFAYQLYKPFYIGAIGEPLVHVSSVCVRQCDRNRDLGSGMGRDGNSPVCGAGGNSSTQFPGIVIDQIGDLTAPNLAAFCLLSQNCGIQGVCFLPVREIHHFKVHGIDARALRVVAQLKFGFVGALHLNVSLRGHGRRRIGQTRALAADEVEGVVGFIYNGSRRAHEQAVDQIGQPFLCHTLFLQILPHQGC